MPSDEMPWSEFGVIAVTLGSSAGAILLLLRAPIVLAGVAVIAGTLVGERAMLGMSRARFTGIAAIAAGLPGVWLLAGSFGRWTSSTRESTMHQWLR